MYIYNGRKQQIEMNTTKHNPLSFSAKQRSRDFGEKMRDDIPI